MPSGAGRRLADIVVCAREHIKVLQLRSNRAYRYIEKMCRQHSDYAGRAAELTYQAEQQEQVSRDRSRATLYAHKRYADGAGIMVQIFDGIAEVLRDGQWLQTLAGRAMEQVYGDIERGRLVEITA